MAGKATVRWLVAGEILLVIIALAIPAQGPYPMFGEGWGAGKWQEQAPLLGWPLLMFGIAAYAGVCQFKPWGRVSYLVYHLLDLFSILATGVVHMPPLASIFYWAGYLLAAIVLYLLYFTPLKAHFKKAGAGPGPAVPEEPVAASEASLAMAAEPCPAEMRSAAAGDEAQGVAQEPAEKNLVDRFTDLIFPGSAAVRAREKPPEQRKKRRALLLEHYGFILFIFFAIMLTEFKINALVIAALGYVIFNLAQRKGQPLAVLFPAILAAYCLVPIASSLFGFLLSNYSKDILPYLIPYIAGWLLLMKIEIGTHKFIRDCDQPLPKRSKGEGAKPDVS